MARSKSFFFNTGHFLQLYEAIFIDAINATGNAGQSAILNEIYETSAVIAAGFRTRPGPNTCRALFLVCSNPDKYVAVKYILEEIAGKVPEAWDDSQAGDNKGQKMYLSIAPEDFIDTPPSSNAMMNGLRSGLFAKR